MTRALAGDDAAGELDTRLVQPIADLRSQVDDLRDRPDSDRATAVSNARKLVDTLSANYDEFTSVDSAVLVQPFVSKVELAVDDVNSVSDWYAPAAVVLMLQQFGVAFGALSFVRERQLGITDVFRVAPVNATETLIGKYLAYLIIGSAIGAALTALVVVTLDVPLAASIADVALVMGLSLFASIGLGFVVSLISSNDAQAVQYTMIILLASLFFSGFFLSLGQLQGVARAVSWLLPVTYGMELLRDVMLRGAPIDTRLAMGLGAYGVVAFLLALLGTRRRMGLRRA